jgi:hypothetical protein
MPRIHWIVSDLKTLMAGYAYFGIESRNFRHQPSFCFGSASNLHELNWRKFVKFVSKVFADGHRLISLHFARKTFNLNRKLATEAVLKFLRTRLPRQYEIAEVAGKWVWLAALLWALGFHWNRRRGVWQHLCSSFDPLGSHPTDPRAKNRSYFPADVLPV